MAKFKQIPPALISVLTSRTVWLSLATLIASIVVLYRGVQLDPQLLAAVGLAISGAIFGVRAVTRKPLLERHKPTAPLPPGDACTPS